MLGLDIAELWNSTTPVDWHSQSSSYIKEPQAHMPITGSGLPAIAFAFILLLVYLSSTLNFWVGIHLRKTNQTPLTLPYALPVFGHTLWYSWDTQGFALMAKRKFQEFPLKLRLMVMNPILLTKAADVEHVFSHSAAFTNKPYRNFVCSTFGLPQKFSDFYIADDSGWRPKPHPQSHISPENRVDYLMHTFITRFFSGSSLMAFTTRFTANMTTHLANASFGDEWTEGLDLFRFLKAQIFHSFVDAVFGKRIFELNPSLCDDFWDFDSNVPDLAKGIPRWLSPGMYRARDRCLQSFVKWHSHLDKQRLEGTTKIDSKYDPVFGSELMQQRHKAFSNISAEIVCAQAKASEDLALMWATNANAVHSAFWVIYQILQYPEVLARFLQCIKSAELAPNPTSGPGTMKQYRVDALCSSPYLSSVFAETLRLRVANLLLRDPLWDDFHVREWRVPRRTVISIMSYNMQHDEKAYNIGTPEDPHPISEFWAERFLVPAPEMSSGTDSHAMQVAEEEADSSNEAWVTSAPAHLQPTDDGAPKTVFSTAGLKGNWIPFGGGAQICPGRNVAKQEILLTAALLLGNFEIELTGPPPVADWRFFGAGALGVKGKQACRVRRRRY